MYCFNFSQIKTSPLYLLVMRVTWHGNKVVKGERGLRFVP